MAVAGLDPHGQGGLSPLYVTPVGSGWTPLGRALLLTHTRGGPAARLTRLKENCPAMPWACSYLCVPVVRRDFTPQALGQ